MACQSRNSNQITPPPVTVAQFSLFVSPDISTQINYTFAGMNISPNFDKLRKRAGWRVALLVLLVQAFALASAVALPKRLVLALDGISYRDVRALQEGVSCADLDGRQFQRKAFTDGYFPVSRNISTFPSTSDVAWTDIFGDRPLPGYQRTYFSNAQNREISENSVTSNMEHERQMHWQVESGLRRALAYVYPLWAFKYELREVANAFLNSRDAGENYYAYLRTTDDAQHMSGDIFAMLGMLDDKLKELRALYRAREGRELEILIISDHGHNRAGAGKRVEIRPFLESAGYRVAKSIVNPRDVVLPTCGIESWVEIHNAPAETEKLARTLCNLEGMELVTARMPDQPNRFLVMNSKGERALIECNSINNSFRYLPDHGDPLNYRPVVDALAKENRLDVNGFATAGDWMAATMTNRYPLALERIVTGLTRITLNPATILVSLNNGYVNAGWLVDKSSRLLTLGGTHGGLDDLNSDGIVLSNFVPTQDTSTSRVAAQFEDFQGLRNYRAGENGAEWVTGNEQALTRIARMPFDSTCRSLPGEALCLRIWTPEFAHLEEESLVEATIEKAPRFSHARIHRWDPDPDAGSERHLALNQPVSVSAQCPQERIYALPPALGLQPETSYRITGWILRS